MIYWKSKASPGLIIVPLAGETMVPDESWRTRTEPGLGGAASTDVDTNRGRMKRSAEWIWENMMRIDPRVEVGG